MYNEEYLIPEWRTAPKRAIRDGVGEGLVLIGDDERVVVLTGDLAESTRVKPFAEVHPDRFLEMGVAEQNMAGVASGMASEGLIPFISSFATFSPGRNWEQIRVSIAMSAQNVKIIGSHGGAAVGENGPTHQATEDIALMRVLPNMTVLVPCDATQCSAAIEAAYKHSGPVYIRTARPKVPDFTKPGTFEIGKIYKYRDGQSVTVAACGIHVWEALRLAEELEGRGVECEVLNVSSVKPLDVETLVMSAKKTKRVVTVEDHQIMGGMGGAISEALSSNYAVPVLRLGVNDRFGVSAPWEEVYRKVGIDRDTLRERIVRFVLD